MALQATWAMSFSTLPPDSRTLVSKWNTKLALIWKEDFGPLGNSPVLLVLSPGKTPLTTTVALTRLCVVALDALTPVSVQSLWSSLKFLNRFCLTILIRLRFSRLVVHLFLPHFFLPLNFLLTCLDTALCSNEFLWLTLLVKGVNNCLLDSSSLPHDCVAYEPYQETIINHNQGIMSLCRPNGFHTSLSTIFNCDNNINVSLAANQNIRMNSERSYDTKEEKSNSDIREKP